MNDHEHIDPSMRAMLDYDSPPEKQITSSEERERELQFIRELADKLQQQPFVTEGKTTEVTKETHEIEKAIRESAKKFRGTKNGKEFLVAGVAIRGSRSLGYATEKSDVEPLPIIIGDRISPDDYFQRLEDTLVQSELDATKLLTDYNFTLTSQIMTHEGEYSLNLDSDSLTHWHENNPEHAAALFGNFVYETKDLLLLRAVILKISLTIDPEGELWQEAVKRYNETALGTHVDLIKKLHNKTGLPKNEIAEIITPELCKERYRKFGINNRKKKLEETMLAIRNFKEE